MVSHDQKIYAVPHFNHLDQKDVMVLLMTPLVLCDANTIGII